MSQLIARIDEALHQRLKARAAAEGRSLNALVTDVLAEAVEQFSERAAVRARLAASGRLVVPPQPRGVPPRDAVIAATRGTDDRVSAALEAERSVR